MILRRFGCQWLGILAATTLLGACAGLQSAAVLRIVPQAFTKAAPALHVRSWMRQGVSKNDLLYVSDGSHEVYVYNYPKGTLVGTLGGFEGANFMCVDRAGDIFIPSSDLGEVLEYAHGGTNPIATLSDPAGSGYACSVDPKTGNLAVANLHSNGTSADGNIAVYRHAMGTPKIYVDSNFYSYNFCAYDNQGDLFIEGYAEVGYFEFSELPAGHKSFREITLDKIPWLENGLQWEGTYLAVATATSTGSNHDTYIYRVHIDGQSGKTVGTTQLDEGAVTRNFFIQGWRVIATGAPQEGATQFFRYPGGGAAIKTLTQPDSVGAVVSRGS